MDGYAVRAADLPGVLEVVDRSAAGRPSEATLGAGQAIEISTGAVVPDGADTVVPVEHVEVAGDRVTIREPVPTRDNIREPGGDVRTGSALISPGDVLTPARLGALAACGIESAIVHRVPRVTIVVTGTELRPAGEPLARGQIYESNGLMLAAALEAAGASITRLAATEDTKDAHAASLEKALEADVVVTSGGVSVGPHDLVRAVQARTRRRGGLLGRRDEAGEASRLWLPGSDARLRLAGKPRLRSRRSAALRPSGATRPHGAPRSGTAVSPGRPGGTDSAAPGAGRLRQGAGDVGRRRCARRADRGPGVSHDRPYDSGHRARLDSPGAGIPSRRVTSSLPAPLRWARGSGATCAFAQPVCSVRLRERRAAKPPPPRRSG